MLRRHAVTAAMIAALAVATPASWAQEPPTKPIRDLFAFLPMPTKETFFISYADLQAFQIDDLKSLPQTGLPQTFAMAIAMDTQEPGGFADRTGFAPGRIGQIAFAEMVPGFYPTAIRLHDVSPADLPPVWIRRGYVESGSGEQRLWTRGKPGEIQRDYWSQRDPSDLLRHDLGASAVLALDGSTLLLAALPETMAVMTSSAKTGAGAASRTDLTLMLDALDKAVEPGETPTVLKWVPQPDAAGDAASAVMMDMMGQRSLPDADKARSALEAATGIPSYPSLLIAETRSAGTTPAAILALLFSDCAIAESAGAVAAAKWSSAATVDPESPFGALTARWSSITVEGGCVLLGRVAAKTASADTPQQLLVAAIMRRTLYPLQTGPAPRTAP